MSNNGKQNTNIKDLGMKLLLVLFDIFAVNISYYLALLIRFYVNHEFHLAGTLFLPLFLEFAPWYTVCCIVVFWLFKLYQGIWRYAGFNDINRIAAANLVTCLIQIFGTLLFVRRMPITYYVLGALIQFALVALSRFSYRLFMLERSKFAQRRDPLSVNVMIVGSGETARMVLHQFDRAEKSLARPVCVVDYRNHDAGMLFDGLPVVGGVENIGGAIEKYGVKSVIIADAVMPAETREQVREICRGKDVEVQDVSLHSQGGSLSFLSLIERANGRVELVLDGKAQRFESGEQAAQAFAGRYRVRAVSAKEDRLVIELENDRTPLNSVNEAWVRDYETETGEAVSFF